MEDNSMKLSRTDRDMLVVLNTKVDQLTVDVREVKDGLVTRMARVEQRLDQMDVYHASIPLESYKMLAQWAEGRKSNEKFLFPLVGLLLAIVGATVARAIALVFHF